MNVCGAAQLKLYFMLLTLTNASTVKFSYLHSLLTQRVLDSVVEYTNAGKSQTYLLSIFSTWVFEEGHIKFIKKIFYMSTKYPSICSACVYNFVVAAGY